MVFLSIVIPCRNESASLPNLCPALEKVLKQHLKNDWEVLLVDDASTDNTRTIIQSFAKKNKNFKPFHLEKQGGQTGAYQLAFSVAKGKYILRMDGDFQDDPEDLPIFIEKMKQGYELIVGIRASRKHPRLLRFLTRVFDTLAVLLFDSPFHAASSSYIAFQSKYLKNLQLRKNDHRYLICIALTRGVQRPAEVITRHRDRLGGKSKYNVFKKMFLGPWEFLLFAMRAKFGCYTPPPNPAPHPLNDQVKNDQVDQVESP